MASFVPTNPETLEDQRLYTEARLVEVACLDCLARVRVKKNSEHHTSVQWSTEALAACPDLSRRDRSSARRDVHRPCPRMTASIEDAVRAGDVPIGALDGY
ncbi:hypothetical protein JK386_03390 [Nocardioides sp. zg-536]|uniref:Ferredoxin n=1 Tax=Nocardioides faecalis TaxID=2803858 RepID=A0A938Y649_9ACTN|nr:hypothetical protein [Nocardioides faecalis]MBM9458933.1 hypothetical protein [Nocardioides faecalis]MBS4753971.1 hypothetical protein [Nocardioides faecalis]QVI60333.1 hypothetical protein KG111_08650 [Nocardioides faecalis]